MFKLLNKKRLYSHAAATFELKSDGYAQVLPIGLSMSCDDSVVYLSKLEWVCELTKRAVAQAINDNPGLDPKKLSIKLVDFDTGRFR